MKEFLKRWIFCEVTGSMVDCSDSCLPCTFLLKRCRSCQITCLWWTETIVNCSAWIFKIIVVHLFANRCKSRGRRNNVWVCWMVQMWYFRDFVRARSSRPSEMLYSATLTAIQLLINGLCPGHLVTTCSKLVNTFAVPTLSAMAETCLRHVLFLTYVTMSCLQ